MSNRLPLFCFLASLFLLAGFKRADAQVFTGAKLAYSSNTLQSLFTNYEVYRLDAQPFATHVQSGAEGNSTLVLGDHVWNLGLSTSDLLSTTYFSKVEGPNGATISHHRPNIAFKGYLDNGGKVRLTLDKDFVYGYIQEGNLEWRIEPLRYLEPGSDQNLFVVYEKSNVVPNPNVTCGVTEEMEKMAHLDDKEEGSTNTAEMVGVYELELAIASDQLMLAKYGSTGAVEAHNIAVINDVEGDYTGQFNHDICFNIVTQFIATSFPGPWSNSNDAGTLLGSFQTWGNANNFGVTFDVGELWTDRDFTGGTVGIAYLNGVCNSVKYHCLQDFTDNSGFLRCMTSHELGHNFSATHDNGCNGGEFIMCPFVSSSTTWSDQSFSQMNPYMQSKINSGCLASCQSGPPLVSAFDWDPEPGCVGQPVQFTDQSTGLIATWLWTFTGGTPATSNQQNPVATFNTPGPHSVSLLVSSSSGNSNASTQIINIDPLPVANFTYTVDDLTFTFTNASTNATTYLWDFGDGGESTDTDPTYTYSVAGTYVVTLYATNHCGTATKTFTVNTFPAPDFSAEPRDGCASLLVQMVNESSQNSTSFQWQFPGGSPAASNTPNPSVLYTTSGTYSITLTAFNSAGSNTITKTNYITVHTVPSPGFTYTLNGLTATFTNSSVNATSYLWNFGDGGTSTLQNPTHTYAAGGSYIVTLSATNDCGTLTTTKTLMVAPAPTASFTTSSTSGCAPLTVVLTNTSSNAVSYSWALPGGSPATSTDANPTVVYNNPGVYTITLTATNASGSSTATATITVNNVPTAGFSSMVNGVNASFTNSSTGATSYSWNFGDGGTSTDTDPTHAYATDGSYTVTLTATNACGSTTSTQTVVVVTPPVAGFNATPTTGCAPLTVQFNNTSSLNATSYEWTFAGGNPASSTAQNPTVVYNTPGTYSVTLVASNSAGSNTFTQTDYITINTTPTANFSSSTNGTTVTFTNSSSNATSYSWNFGDGDASTETNPTHTYANDGTYTVILSATNACGTVTSTQTVAITTAPTASFNAPQTNGCAPFTVTFNNTSSNNSSSFLWEFEGGTPATSTDVNPTVVYNTPGVYSVTLTATNGAGSSTATQAGYITVGSGPSAGFSAVVNNATATFTNTSTNGTSYAWDFGDNQTGTDISPVHTYANDGTYTVVLTTTNTCGTSTFTQNVVIVTNPEAGFTANTTSGCGPLTVMFTDLSSDNTTGWLWQFEGGTPNSSTEQNPTVVYAIPGVYDVTLQVTNSGGTNSFTRTDFITVLAPPMGGFTSLVTQNSVAFTNTSTNATSYMWTFGDGGSSIETNPTHAYANDGVYTVILAATNSCGTTIFEQTVTIVTEPVAAFTFNSSMGCAPMAVLFNNTSSNNATSFSWTFEGGSPATSTDANPVCTWNTPGVYLVTLTASNGAGSSTATASITVNNTPTASFTTQTAGLTVITTNTSINADSYAWTFGDGSTSTDANPTHTYAGPGNYTITLVATNGCGTTTTTSEISMQGAPPIPAIMSNLTTGCAGMTVQFTDASAGAPTSWAWTFTGGTPATSSEQNPAVTYTTAGTYDVALTVSNAYGSSTTSSPAYITVLSAPTPGYTFVNTGGDVKFTNTSSGGSSYSWDFGDGTTSTEENPTHTYAASGTYTVTQTVTNACGASSLQQTITIVISGVQEASWVDQFRLYPNPNAGEFTVEMHGVPQKAVEFALFNSLGQLISTEVVDFSTGNLTKDLQYANLPAALYTLRVQSANEAIYVKVAVQR